MSRAGAERAAGDREQHSRSVEGGAKATVLLASSRGELGGRTNARSLPSLEDPSARNASSSETRSKRDCPSCLTLEFIEERSLGCRDETSRIEAGHP